MIKKLFGFTPICMAMAGSLTMSVSAQAADPVTVYTAAPQTIVDELVPLFTEQTGLEVEIVKAGTGELINRIKAEGEGKGADVIWSVGGEVLDFNADLFETYEPAEVDKINISKINNAYR